MKKVILIAMLVIAGYSRTYAQVVISDKTGWHKIGENTVDFKTETDEILVIGADRSNRSRLKFLSMPQLIWYHLSFILKAVTFRTSKLGKTLKALAKPVRYH